MSGFPVILLLIVALGVMTSAALFTPKGPHQVYVLLHSDPSVASILLQDDSNRHYADRSSLLPAVDGHVHGSATSFSCTASFAFG
ncbi:hypothetical protein EYR38_007666 [Pleurotus pulmonarius]|nr:hypothetical protein EYR38_007666 [Pleurotus pulmonarius]